MINFAIDPFHYFNKNLLNEDVMSITIVDWKKLFNKRKKQFNDHLFIVIQEDKTLFLDTYLLSLIKVQYKDNCININIDTDLASDKINIYIIQLHKDEQCLNITTTGEEDTTIIHENIIEKKGHSIVNIHSKNNLNLYYFSQNFTEQLSHQEISIENQGNINLFLLEREQEAKTKVDIQCNLFQNSILNYNLLSKTQSKQLRDDTIEVIHKESNSKSYINYFSLNNGKSVSQVNTVIQEESLNCETHQNIKHILMSEKAQSFSRPNLMIYNPEVIATHGNNMGTFPKDNLIYLQQKGFTEEKAIEIIINSIILNYCNKTPYFEQFKKYFFNE